MVNVIAPVIDEGINLAVMPLCYWEFSWLLFEYQYVMHRQGLSTGVATARQMILQLNKFYGLPWFLPVECESTQNDI